MTTKELLRMWMFVFTGMLVSVALAFAAWSLVMINMKVGMW